MTQNFIGDRQYLKVVSPKTIIWYGCFVQFFCKSMTGADNAFSPRDGTRVTLSPREKLEFGVKQRLSVR